MTFHYTHVVGTMIMTIFLIFWHSSTLPHMISKIIHALTFVSYGIYIVAGLHTVADEADAIIQEKNISVSEFTLLSYWRRMKSIVREQCLSACQKDQQGGRRGGGGRRRRGGGIMGEKKVRLVKISEYYDHAFGWMVYACVAWLLDNLHVCVRACVRVCVCVCVCASVCVYVLCMLLCPLSNPT